MADEGFREIQLSPKTLVALFMAATVVGVVVFLCGVIVGRGVRNAAPASASVEAPPPAPVPDNAPTAEEPANKQPATPPTSSASGTSAANVAPPTPPAEDLSYYGRLEGTKKDEALKKPANPPSRESKNAAAASKAIEPASAEPESAVWTVQVGAYAKQSQADAVVKHLKSKRYDVYVPSPGSDGMYKVRVGRFKDRKEAETVKSRIEKEEQYKPWITR